MIAKNQDVMFCPKDVRPSIFSYLNPANAVRYIGRKLAYMRTMLICFNRRQGWLIEKLTFRKAVNMAVTGAQFALKSERMHAMPVAVKIDISPMCNLSCTVCVHADPNGSTGLEKQVFDPKHRMSVAQFKKIIDEIKGTTAAVSLYYIGDPLVHPDLDEMCSVARDAGLNVHVSTNFSFALSDERLKRMINSGLTHLSICVDGLSQQKYEMTRVGGKIDRVLNNLERICRIRREMKVDFPKIEVQYIKFQHNLDEIEKAQQVVESYGVDQFTHFWGSLHNYVDHDPGTFEVMGPNPKKALPQCYWPHSSVLIKYNGDVIPCCTYRIGQQYTEVDDPRVMGNVFKTSLREVWNGEKYRQARRMVSNPQVVNKDPSLAEHFCYGCPAIFETNEPEFRRRANEFQYDDVFEITPGGRPVRKEPAPVAASRLATVSQIGLPNGQSAAV